MRELRQQGCSKLWPEILERSGEKCSLTRLRADGHCVREKHVRLEIQRNIKMPVQQSFGQM